jgi:ribosomal-protein-serine acetyltransferase
VIRYAFETLGFHRVELRSSEENQKSRRIAERLGFTLEGLARESCKLASGFHNMQVFSLLSSEF